MAAVFLLRQRVEQTLSECCRSHQFIGKLSSSYPVNMHGGKHAAVDSKIYLLIVARNDAAVAAASSMP